MSASFLFWKMTIQNIKKVLEFLGKVDEASQTKISEQTKIHPYLLKPLLELMESKNLIERRTNANGTFTYFKIKLQEV